MPVTDTPPRDRFFSDAEKQNHRLLTIDESALSSELADLVRSLDDQNLHRRPRTSRRWATKLDQALQALDDALEDGHHESVVIVAESVIGELAAIMGEANDFHGCFDEIVERLEALHHQACVSASVDRTGLARRLFHFEVDVEWPVFADAMVRYADVLEDDGRAEFRRLVDEAWATLTPIGAGEPSPDRYGRRGRITRVAERMAEIDGDLDRIIAIRAHDLSLPSDWLELAELCRDEDRADEALYWAERGLHAFGAGTCLAFDDFLYEQYHDHDLHEDAVELAWLRFCGDPGIRTYQRLRSQCRHDGAWATWRPQALDVLRNQTEAAAGRAIQPLPESSEVWTGSRWFRLAAPPANATIVEVLLWEQSFDEAWAEAKVVGCSHDDWLRMANEREGAHPTDAIPIYQREIEELIDQRENEAYEGAVRLLGHVRHLCRRVGWTSTFTSFVDGLRETHKQKRNLITLLDGTGW